MKVTVTTMDLVCTDCGEPFTLVTAVGPSEICGTCASGRLAAIFAMPAEGE
jgi:hypothetical protein